MPLRQKGRQIVKRVNLPLIVLSNYPMREVYSKCSDVTFATVQRRFLQVELKAPMKVEIVTVERGSTDSSSRTQITSTAPGIETIANLQDPTVTITEDELPGFNSYDE